MAIKGAFEGPMNKTLTFVVLDRGEVRVCILIICVYCVCVSISMRKKSIGNGKSWWHDCHLF